MKFQAKINVMPQQEILDPQGKAVGLGLKQMGMENVTGVRIGKHITMEVEAESKEAAAKQVEQACQKLLANLIMEQYSYEILS
ncbi:MAG: phosphoribosylformylglycinamidine synthase subunit PurS [Bacteroidetes bacterium]|nr:MAG: phosphoribosylformylglycinamidine synthase subunit PurS [Bacteroidota bacterium]